MLVERLLVNEEMKVIVVRVQNTIKATERAAAVTRTRAQDADMSMDSCAGVRCPYPRGGPGVLP